MEIIFADTSTEVTDSLISVFKDCPEVKIFNENILAIEAVKILLSTFSNN